MWLPGKKQKFYYYEKVKSSLKGRLWPRGWSARPLTRKNGGLIPVFPFPHVFTLGKILNLRFPLLIDKKCMNIWVVIKTRKALNKCWLFKCVVYHFITKPQNISVCLMIVYVLVLQAPKTTGSCCVHARTKKAHAWTKPAEGTSASTPGCGATRREAASPHRTTGSSASAPLTDSTSSAAKRTTATPFPHHLQILVSTQIFGFYDNWTSQSWSLKFDTEPHNCLVLPGSFHITLFWWDSKLPSEIVTGSPLWSLAAN